MRLFPAFLIMAVLCSGGSAQSSPSAPKRAAVQGVVTRDPEGQPIKKALIELIAENQSEGGNYTAVTGPDGGFRIEDILPGRYRLFAERTGFLDMDRHRSHTDGRVLTLTAGQDVRDLHIRLQAAAVVRGHVTDEDGDPLAGAEVSVMRQTFASGHMHWEQAGAERTNDLGEYRIAGLAPGNVYVSVNPPPDFKALIEAGSAGAGRKSADKPSTAYQTTYYPGTTDRSQASPLQVHAGDEIPVDFSLIPAPSLSIRGSVMNLAPRTSATIMLQSREFNVIQNSAEMHQDGTFVIRDVSPGNYTIVASVDGAPVPMTARQSLQVGSTSVDGLRLTPQPGASVRGRLRFESRGAMRVDPERIYLMLQTANGDSGGVLVGDSFSNLAHIAPDGSFAWDSVPSGNYYVELVGQTGVNDDWFLKSAIAGGREINDSGFTVNGGAVLLDVVVSANGGVVDGIVVDGKGQPFANAVVVGVPETRFRGRTDRYRKITTDQAGRFSLRGMRPGEYMFFAWESVDGDAYYDPEFLRTFDGQGSSVRIGEGEHKTLQMNLIPEQDQQQ